MRFTHSDEIPWPRELVFRTFRDRTPDLLPYLPSVAELELIEENIDGPLKRSIKRWRGSSDEIPGALRPLVRPDLLEWLDHATWDEQHFTCEWRHEFRALPGAISARGTTRYSAEGEATRITIEGEFTIRPQGLTFVPQVIARKLAPTLERFVVGQIKPNLRGTNDAMAALLEDEQD